MDYQAEAKRLLPCESDCCETHRVECPVAFRPAVAAALQAAAEDGKKKLAEMTHIRDFAIRCLIKATGATKEQVQAAPYELAVKIKAEIVQLRAENAKLETESKGFAQALELAILDRHYYENELAKLTAERDGAIKSHCGTCDGSGVVDSGGVTPWDAPIDIACPECKAKRDDAVVQGLEISAKIFQYHRHRLRGVSADAFAICADMRDAIAAEIAKRKVPA